MSETSWTPGPWRRETPRSWRVVGRDPRGINEPRDIADTFCGVRCGNTDHSEADADAELIALAPEMADILLAMNRMHEQKLQGDCTCDVCHITGKLRAIGGNNE